MARTLKGLASIVVLLALLVGLPLLLAQTGGNPLPSSLPTWDEIVTSLTSRDNGEYFLGALLIVGWLGWLTFAIAVVVEIPAQLRGVRAPRLRALSFQQRAAGALIGAVLTMVVAPAVPSMAAPVEHSVPSAIVRVDDAGSDTPASEAGAQSQTPAALAPDLPTHLVQSGDSLWSLAQTHLGNGGRWTEIRDLNIGVPQPDGYALEQGSDWIEPGWTLKLPADAIGVEAANEVPAASTTASTSQEYVVQEGDTLYQIAQKQLGDGNLYPSIVEASREIDQGAGVHLTDPNSIDVGWTLTLPASSAVDETPATTPAPAVDETVAPTESIPSPDSDAQVAVEDVEEASESIPVRTIGGVGAILAAGILGVLAVRRQRANRTRPPGARVAMPAPDSTESAVEAELRAVADPMGLDTVDRALRGLAAWCTREQQPLPNVRAARLTADGSEFWLFLDEPAALPDPWEGSPDERVWVLRSDEVDASSQATDPADVPAPWPSLVTLGHDEEDAHLMLDLEQIGHLDIRGDRDAAQGTLAALAVELATSHWADDLQVTLVGTLPGLGDAIDTSRIRYVSGLSTVMKELQARARYMREHSVSRETASEWTPEILIIGTELDEAARAQLDALVVQLPRVGIAALTSDAEAGEWALDIDSETPTEGVLSPTGLRIRPQQIVPAEYAQILSVLTGAEQHIEGPTWTTSLAATTEPTLDTLPEPIDEPEFDAEHVPEETFAVTATETPREHPVEILADEVDVPITEPTPVRALHAPLVRLLGEVDITGVDKSVLSRQSDLDQAVEITTYLVLNPGATGGDLSRDIWPGKGGARSTRNSAISRARKLLGINGENLPYLEYTTNTATDDNPYRLHGVSSDWGEFTELRSDDPTQTPLEQLRKALALVRGAPFDRLREGRTRVLANRYTWVEVHAQEMRSSIVDVACETSRRALLEGKPRLAAEAAEAGLRAYRDDERVWRYAIRSAAQLGEHRRVQELVDDLTAHLTDLDVDPQPETNDLLDELAHTHHRAAAG